MKTNSGERRAGSARPAAARSASAHATNFDRDGWVVVRGVVPEAELVAMRAVFTTLLPEKGSRRGRDSVLQLYGAASRSERLARVARDPRFGALVATALGASRIQLLQDSLLCKPARVGGAVEWHQDHTYVGFLAPPRVVSLRIALHPEDEHTGCMRVVDGSHRWGPIGDVRALRGARVTSLLSSLSPAQRDAIAHARPLALAPGDVSIHHCLTLHASGPNTSAAPRRTIILFMFDACCRLDRSKVPIGVRPHFPTDADGHLARSAFPVVHGGSRRTEAR